MVNTATGMIGAIQMLDYDDSIIVLIGNAYKLKKYSLEYDVITDDYVDIVIFDMKHPVKAYCKVPDVVFNGKSNGRFSFCDAASLIGECVALNDDKKYKGTMYAARTGTVMVARIDDDNIGSQVVKQAQNTSVVNTVSVTELLNGINCNSVFPLSGLMYNADDAAACAVEDAHAARVARRRARKNGKRNRRKR